MKKINLVITGCMGRMGRQIIKSAKSDKNVRPGGLIASDLPLEIARVIGEYENI